MKHLRLLAVLLCGTNALLTWVARAESVNLDSLPPMVRVGEASNLKHLTYDVPLQEFRQLVATGQVVKANSESDYFPNWNFVSPEASTAWFSTTHPVAPVSSATGQPPALVQIGSASILGPAWTSGKRDWFYQTDSDVSVAEVKSQIELACAVETQKPGFYPTPSMSVGRALIIRGAELRKRDKKGRIWVTPSKDGDMLLRYDPATTKWLQHKRKWNRRARITPRRDSWTFESSNGNLFFPTVDGMEVFDGKTWRIQSLFDANYAGRSLKEFVGLGQRLFCEDARGNVYVWARWDSSEEGTYGFWEFSNGRWRNFEKTTKIKNLECRPNGNLWLTTDKGLVAWNKGVRSILYAFEAEADGQYVRSFFDAGENGVWPTSGGRIHVVRNGNELSGSEIAAALKLPYQCDYVELAATTPDGVQFLTIQSPRHVGNGSASDFMGFKILPDGKTLELGADAGRFLMQISKKELDSQNRLWTIRRGQDIAIMDVDGRILAPPTPLPPMYGTYLREVVEERWAYVEGGGRLWQIDTWQNNAVQSAAGLLPALHIQVAGNSTADTNGNIWCRWHFWDSKGEDAVTANFDGKKWTAWPATSDRTNAEPPHFLTQISGYDSLFPGRNGSLLAMGRDMYNKSYYELFDSGGHIRAKRLEDLMEKYPERLQQALPFLDSPLDSNGRKRWQQLSNYESLQWLCPRENSLGQHRPTFVSYENKLVLGSPDDFSQTLAQKLAAGRGIRLYWRDSKGNFGLSLLEKDGMTDLFQSASAHSQFQDAQKAEPHSAWKDSRDRLWLSVTRDLPTGMDVFITSVALNQQGKITAIVPGILSAEAPDGVLWFFQADWHNQNTLVRKALDGSQTQLVIPYLSKYTALAPDGSIWALTDSELIHIRLQHNQLQIVARHAVNTNYGNAIWCDTRGRVWQQDRNGGGELICYATEK